MFQNTKFADIDGDEISGPPAYDLSRSEFTNADNGAVRKAKSCNVWKTWTVIIGLITLLNLLLTLVAIGITLFYNEYRPILSDQGSGSGQLQQQQLVGMPGPPGMYNYK